MRKTAKWMRLFFVATVLTLFTSCNEDDIINYNPDDDTYNYQDSNRTAQTDDTVEGTLNIMESGFIESVEGTNQTISLFPDCTTITIQPNGSEGVITLDFGNGCILNNGAVVEGIITLNYGAVIAGTRTINYTFDGFSYNQNLVTGNGVIFRELANAQGFPQSTVNESLSIAFPSSNVTATREGMRVAVWVAGVGSGTWVDNVYHITGNWDTQLTNGFSRSGVVTEKLVRKLNCAYIESGRLEVTQNDISGTIDWGDGSCDNRAVLEVGGLMYDIEL